MSSTLKYKRKNAHIGNVDLVIPPDAKVEILEKDEAPLEIFFRPTRFERVAVNNRYYIPYPPEFKTLNNTKFRIGIRNILLEYERKSLNSRVYIFQQNKATQKYVDFSFDFDYSYPSNENIYDILIALNKAINNNITLYNARNPGNLYLSYLTIDFYGNVLWLYTTNRTTEYIFYIEFFFYNQEFKDVFGIITSPESPATVRDCHPCIRDNKYLVKASFTNSISQNYIGITNTQYTIPKYYDVKTDDSEFYIELYYMNGEPIRHIQDAPEIEDMLLIEAVLIKKELN